MDPKDIDSQFVVSQCQQSQDSYLSVIDPKAMNPTVIKPKVVDPRVTYC